MSAPERSSCPPDEEKTSLRANRVFGVGGSQVKRLWTELTWRLKGVLKFFMPGAEKRD